ncbi:putative protease [Pelagirhabdus alkalitolerans]|uniref:Putative protease n=1 Tax=Pelagirhabdus alkalitolerans TaxID=1612202 RepID=A0A1G6H966_9BACI|nr:peptidase U32 family protein [Pelagirhabdus alkalitolerans]SDB90694.1 putative protease [Pelagirhabdus alkalitolerans]
MNQYKPELQATAKDLDELFRLSDAGADSIYVGHQDFANRASGDLTIDEIKQATEHLQAQNKKIYVMVNAIYHNEHLKALPSYLKQLESINVDGIVAGDQAIYQVIKDIGSSLSINWHPSTLATNYQTLKFWHKRGLSRATLSNELSLDAVREIKEQVDFPIDIQIHGMTNIFQSKRRLVQNYYDHVGQYYDPDQKRFIKEDRKEDTHYPIFEDKNGTHIMSNEDLMMIDHLDIILDAEIDGLKIEGILKETDYNEAIVAIYREAIDTYLADPEAYQQKKSGWKQRIYQIQPNDRRLNTGFYFKEQIY